MFHALRRRPVTISIPHGPRFAPRLEALESRFAPACTFNPATGVLSGGSNNTALIYYVPWSDGQDVYCNSQYVGTSYADVSIDPGSGVNWKVELDTTLSSTAANYYLGNTYATFGNTITFLQGGNQVIDVAFILGIGANTVTVIPPSNSGIMPSATVVGWNSNNPSKVVVDDSAFGGTDPFLITQNQISSQDLDVIANLYWVNEVTLLTGAGAADITVKNTAGSLGTMPLVYVDGNGGSDYLTIDASAYSVGEKYSFDEERFSMPDYLRNVVWYRDIEYITLKAGSGNDQTTLRNTSGNLLGLPLITVNGGLGADSLTADHASYNSNGNYYLTELGLAFSGYGDVFYYQSVENVTFKTGTSEDFISIGSNQNKLAGIPDIDVQAGTGAANVLFFMDPANLAPETYTLTENQLLLPQSLGLIATFSNVNFFHLHPGSGTNVVNLAPTNGSLLSMARYFAVHGGAGSDTINIYDSKNPNATTYIATSSSPGAGAITIPGTNFGLYFDSTNEVNLYRSLKPGSTVNTDGYNPAHYVLNIIAGPTEGSGLGGVPRNPVVFNPPAPPADGPSDSEPLTVPRQTRGANLFIANLSKPEVELTDTLSGDELGVW